MDFKRSLEEGYAKEIKKNKNRAKSLVKSSDASIKTAKIIPINEISLKSIFRELYEGFRECCEALGYSKGYKFLDHESIGFFLRDILNEQIIFKRFDRYRKLRNGINYYGNDIETETVKEAVSEIPKLVQNLQNHYKIQQTKMKELWDNKEDETWQNP